MTAAQLIAANIRRERKSRGLTQSELAEMIGVHQPTIAEIESGRGDPLASTVDRFAAALGVPVADLFDTTKISELVA